MLGQNPATVFPQFWGDLFVPVMERAWQRCEATTHSNSKLFMMGRAVDRQESYYDYTFCPILGASGDVMGVYVPVTETTQANLAERRMKTLLDMSAIAQTRSMRDFWDGLLTTLEQSGPDIGFALVYALDNAEQWSRKSVSYPSASDRFQDGWTGPNRCVLKGTVGVTVGHGGCPSVLDMLNDDQSCFSPAFRKAASQQQPLLLLRELDKTLPEGQKFPSRMYRDHCSQALVYALRPTANGTTYGFIVIGLNPRRPYDEEYQQFCGLLGRQLAASVASAILYGEEVNRVQRELEQAAANEARLSRELALQRERVERSETRFAKFMEFAPVGLSIHSLDGCVAYQNTRTRELCDVDGMDPDRSLSWTDFYHADDVPLAQAKWEQVVRTRQPVSYECRLKRLRHDLPQLQEQSNSTWHSWILASILPEISPDGDVTSIMGCFTEITHQKWAEELQRRRVDEALESKRQQENFVDMTSHEIRNPLNAIFQCSDEVIKTCDDVDVDQPLEPSALKRLITSHTEAAQTISECASHQKRIVDDILTLSKIDADILNITPSDVQPEALVRQTMRMFKNELRDADIKMDLQIQDSFRNCNVDWVKLDPTRIQQILVNLLTNAVRYTKGRNRREITIGICASTIRPSAANSKIDTDIEYLPSRQKRKMPDTSPDTKSSPREDGHYLLITVEDSGKGITADDRKQLFKRFQQSSPRTYAKYGASGLGLFISRALTEMQGGQIGLGPPSGDGCKFAFYVFAEHSKGSGDSKSPDSKAKRPQITPHSKQTSDQDDTKPGTVESNKQIKENMAMLIVEDNLINQRLLKQQLTKRAYTVHVANHGQEALEIIKNSRFWKGNESSGCTFSVMLLDVEMPIMDGLTCVREIRRLCKEGQITKYIPVVAISANARKEQIECAKEAGMDDVVPKPFRIDDLVTAIDSILESLKKRGLV